MVTRKEICIAEGLLLSTWFQIDALSINTAAPWVATNVICIIFMAVTALYFLSFLFRGDKSFRTLCKALWKSDYFDALTTLALGLPWLPAVWSAQNLNVYLSYVLWCLAAATLLIGLLSKQDRTLQYRPL